MVLRRHVVQPVIGHDFQLTTRLHCLRAL
jgi:hypothetical protein